MIHDAQYVAVIVRCLGTKTVKGTTRAFEGVHHIERGDGFPNGAKRASATTNKAEPRGIFKARSRDG